MRSPRGLPQAALPLALALLLAACGSGGSGPEPTAKPSMTPSSTPATMVPEATEAPATETVEATRPSASGCPDPYPEGAPYQPPPGQPPRLRPTGSPPPFARYQPLPLTADPALEQIVRQSIRGDEEHFAVVVKNLADSRGVALAPDRVFFAASLFKTWVMLEAYLQREVGLLDFDEWYVVSDYYERFRLNPGELALCERVTGNEALLAMMSTSDNVAAGLLLDRVGAGNVNAALSSFGLAASGFVPDGFIVTTAADMALLLEAIGRRQAVSAAASDEMLALLSTESLADRLPALLPRGTPVAHKTGSWEDVTHDAGIVFSPRAAYVIVILTDFGFRDDGAARIARLSRAVYDYYNPE